MDRLFKEFFPGRGDDVPLLGRTGMKVIDTVQIVILCVPAKARKTHPYIQIWGIDTTDGFGYMLDHRACLIRQLIQIPGSELLARIAFLELGGEKLIV